MADLCSSYGLVLDDWQEGVLEGSLGERSDGRWAATQVGVAVPRQNGKGALIEARELAGLLLFGEELIIHSAHQVQTALDGFRRIRSYFDNYDDLRKRVRRVRESHTEQGIEFTSGQRLRFMARSKSSGRGFSADCLILDEAQELSDDTWAAMLPTISARANPQIWLLGTPPAPGMSGEVFTRVRLAGHEAKERHLAWFEWSCPGDADLDDRDSWAQANPALGNRIDPERIVAERASMDDATFGRERLGMWDEASSNRVIDVGSWAACADVMSRPAEQFALAVDVNPDRSVASVGFAGLRADGGWHVELDEQRNGVGWLAGWIVDRCARNDIRAVVIDAASPASSIIDELRARKVKVTTTDSRDMARACGMFFDGVMDGWLKHTDQPQVNTALGAARKRPLGDAWAWNRKNSASDITALVACTLALWGAQSSTVKRPVRSGKRTRVVML